MVARPPQGPLAEGEFQQYGAVRPPHPVLLRKLVEDAGEAAAGIAALGLHPALGVPRAGSRRGGPGGTPYGLGPCGDGRGPRGAGAGLAAWAVSRTPWDASDHPLGEDDQPADAAGADDQAGVPGAAFELLPEAAEGEPHGEHRDDGWHEPEGDAHDDDGEDDTAWHG